MACEPETFDGVTSLVFNCLKEKLKKAGYPLEKNEDTIKGPYGIVLNYKWNEAESTLTIHVQEKNFLISCDMINRTILDNLYDCGLSKV